MKKVKAEEYAKYDKFIGSDDPKIERAIKVLCEKYEQAKRLEYVNNKVAWALYYTWVQFDERRGK